MTFVYNVTGRIFTYATDQYSELQQCKLDLVVGGTNVSNALFLAKTSFQRTHNHFIMDKPSFILTYSIKRIGRGSVG